VTPFLKRAWKTLISGNANRDSVENSVIILQMMHDASSEVVRKALQSFIAKESSTEDHSNDWYRKVLHAILILTTHDSSIKSSFASKLLLNLVKSTSPLKNVVIDSVARNIWHCIDNIPTTNDVLLTCILEHVSYPLKLLESCNSSNPERMALSTLQCQIKWNGLLDVVHVLISNDNCRQAMMAHAGEVSGKEDLM